ncbi:hypothetical protein [Streptomyces pratensis]|uniref:hypothetical protein n=1 Tax=Streptomyces pratensis TaxID=1169025 RepID=UPI001EE4D7A2|nr:hypothetical protein [Streptomyces pratensis]
MSEAGESVVTLARWLGHSSPVITLGYYAHFMPEAGSRKPEAGSRQHGARHHRRSARGAGGPTRRPEFPRFSPAPSTGDSCLYAPERLPVNCGAEKIGGLGKCWKK